MAKKTSGMPSRIDGSTRKWWTRWSTNRMPMPQTTPGITDKSASGCSRASHCGRKSNPRSEVTCTPDMRESPASRQ